jgi:signal transduction histidine kinase/CheY-like chemotaxis protein
MDESSPPFPASAPAPGSLTGPDPTAPTILRSERASLRSLVHHHGAVEHDAPIEHVQRLFAEMKVDFLALVHDGHVSGLCSRLRLGILLGSRFGFALYSRSPAHLAQVDHPLVFSESTPIRTVLDKALARHGDEFHEDVVFVNDRHNLIGLIPIDALARLQSQLVAEQVAELRRQHLELFQAGHALRQSKGLYLGLFESHTLGVALLDVNGGVHEYNRRLAELLNFGPDSAALVSLAAWVTETERAGFLTLLAGHAREASVPATREFTLNIPGRGARLFRCSTGWIAETGQICACLDDITEQRSLERHIARQEKQTLLDTLVGGIAHELNNKLTPVQGFSELIELSADAQTRQFAALIAKSVTEAAKIIRQLLQLSKPGATISQTVDLATIVNEAMTMLQFQIRDSSAKLRTTAPAAPVWAQVDAAQIKQVVLNLALNALQATADCDDPELTIEIREGKNTAILVVADNGHGIPPEIINRIFDPFFTTKAPEHGTGLGLSVCFSIVRQHGGEISVESQPGQGARFTVSLPIASTLPLLLDMPDTAAVPAPLRAGLRGVRVLVVEDEIVVARLLQEILHTKFGCQVEVATNGIEAFEKLVRESYALVISDIRMPEMNGTELYLWLREAQPASARRFIFVTGHPGEARLEAEIAQWGVPVVAKPFTISRLSEVCAPYLQSAANRVVAS